MKAILSLLVFISLFSAVNTEAQWYSSNSCQAYTNCMTYDAWGRPYYRGQIRCQTFGGNYGYAGNSCSWYVIPGVSVQCAGYAPTPYGWQWQNFYFVCPRY